MLGPNTTLPYVVSLKQIIELSAVGPRCPSTSQSVICHIRRPLFNIISVFVAILSLVSRLMHGPLFSAMLIVRGSQNSYLPILICQF